MNSHEESEKQKSVWISLLSIFIALYLLFSMVSISLSQIFISLALVCWIIVLIRKEQKFAFPAFFWPLVAYIGLSLIASFLSVNPKASLKDSRELLLFLLVPIVYTAFASEKILKKANLALLASAYVSCIYSILHFFFKTKMSREQIAGFMGQVMTQGGLLMLFCCMAMSMFLLSRNRIKYFWGIGFLFALFSLIIAQTRNAWVGIIFAISLILLFYRPITLIIVPIFIALFIIISPQPIKKRAFSIFDVKGSSNEQRIEFLKAGIKIIRDFPLFGTGPDTVEIVFKDPKYGLSELARKNVHLHNNILQTGAERGIPTLLAWLTFMVWTFLSLLKLLKNKDPALQAFTVAGLAAILGLNVAGLFEYNFADSEITALFLYMITIPFSLARIQKEPHPQVP